jgi:hypothetical protein
MTAAADAALARLGQALERQLWGSDADDSSDEEVSQ